MFTANLLATLLLALSVTATPVLVHNSPVTLPISRRFNFTGSRTILDRDQARAASLRAKAEAFGPDHQGKRAVINSPAENVAVVYQASVGIGSPATQCSYIVSYIRPIFFIDEHCFRRAPHRYR